MTGLPLRISLPLVLLGFILVILLGTLGLARKQVETRVEQRETAFVRKLLNRKQHAIERGLAQGDSALVEEEVTELSANPNLRRAFLADHQDRVVASTFLAEQGQELSDLLATYDPPVADWLRAHWEPVQRFNVAQVALSPAGDALLALAPIRLGLGPGELRPQRSGLLFLHQDLGGAKDYAVGLVNRQVMILSLGLGWMTLMVSVVLYFLVTARVKRLVEATEAISQGQFQLAVPVRGADELAHLARTIEQMARQRAQAEERLQLSTARLTEAQEVAKLGSWEWEISTDRIEWSPQVHQIFGTDPNSFTPSYDAYLAIIQPTDRERVNQAVAQALEDLKPYSIEHRLVLNDGSKKMIAADGRVLLDAAGKPVKLVGVVRDITAEKERHKRINLLAKVFDTANEAIMITDQDNRIVETNAAFEEITGYRLEEVRGKNPRILASGRHSETFYQQMWEQLLSTGQWTGEIWDRRKGGEVYLKYAAITRFYDDTSEEINYLAIFNDISQVKKNEEELRRQAYYDSLTGLPNRPYFLEQLDHHIALAQRQKKSIALLFLDLDNFKHVNDSLGHAAGDELLVEAARQLHLSIRASDLVARLGGDEFVVALMDIKDPGAAASIANQILTAFSRPLLLGGQELFIHCSIGIAIYPQDGVDAQELLRKGDAAMYQAKNHGKGQASFYTADLEQVATRKMFLTSNLYRALENGEFQLLYQPQVDGRDGRIVGAEALVRWYHPDKGVISPAEFIPVAEETGLILPLGEWVLVTACRQAKAWAEAGYPGVVMSVNFSVRQFQQEDVARLIAQVLEQTGLEPGLLKVEITESLMVAEVQRTIDTFAHLRAMGVKTSVDDFGTGYSSLSYLNRFPLDDLKIDRAFVTHIADDDSIARALVGLAESLGLSVIAEGVETSEQRRKLLQLGCQRIQGYYYARPLPPLEFEGFLKRGKIEPT